MHAALNFEREGVKERVGALNFEMEGVKKLCNFPLAATYFSLNYLKFEEICYLFCQFAC